MQERFTTPYNGAPQSGQDQVRTTVSRSGAKGSVMSDRDDGEEREPPPGSRRERLGRGGRGVDAPASPAAGFSGIALVYQHLGAFLDVFRPTLFLYFETILFWYHRLIVLN